jgi:hypothetical protein
MAAKTTPKKEWPADKVERRSVGALEVVALAG